MIPDDSANQNAPDAIWEATATIDDFATFDPVFARSLKRCRTCRTYSVDLLDGLIVSYLPQNASMFRIRDTDVTILSMELLAALEKIIPTPGFWRKGELRLGDRPAAAFQCSYRYQIRGTEHIRYFECPECGYESYMGFGNRYLVGPLGAVPPVFQSWAGALLVTGHVRKGLLDLAVPGLEFEPLGIRPEPADDYPAILRSERRLSSGW